MLMFGLLSSVLIVCALSLDRLSAMRSRKSDHHGKLYIGILGSVWTCAGLYSGIHLLTNRTLLYYPGTWCCVDYVNITNDTDGKINTYSYVAIVLTVVFLIVMLNFLMLFLACCNPELRARLVDRHRIPGCYDYHSYFFLTIVVFVSIGLWTPHLVSYSIFI